MKHSTYLLLSAVLILLAPCTRLAESAEVTQRKAVLVTGASTGIGRNIAERLAGEGYFVYAGARKDGDIAELSEIDHVQGIRLDVTVQADLDAAVATVSNDGRGLYGIVNNAGVVVMGIVAETDESELDYVFDVNVYGPYRVVKSFAPLIVQSKGRIINISSMAGIRSSMAYGVYGMSKHALEAFSDSLRLEMETVGVRSSLVLPGPYNSSAVATNCKRRNNQEYDPGESLFAELAGELAALCQGGDSPNFPEPDAVADSVVHALGSDQPKNRYLAVNHPLQAEAMLRDLFTNLAELNNNGHSYGYSRDELIAMLDDALAASEEN